MQPVKTLKPINLKTSWTDLVRAIELAPCILLKSSGDHFILGWDFEAEMKFEENKFDFDKLQYFLNQFKGHYIFGYLTYDVKNKIENRLSSLNEDRVHFPDAHFLVAKHVIELTDSQLNYFGESPADQIELFFSEKKVGLQESSEPIKLTAATNYDDYIKNVKDILQEIQFGNIYEMNYCVNFRAENANLNSFDAFTKLQQLSEAPFSVYLNTGNHRVLCASPERYIQKTDDKLISQPIKGTARRGKSVEEDEIIKKELVENPKERSENIMIVDLVRNDLSRIAAKNSVRVEELCKVNTFKTVHQLISTISCQLRAEINFTDVIKATFPMGSMTGAPKISAMQIAERMENFKRGLYSGTIGYISPDGDYDFNVVIRSILYNRQTKVVSCSVGGAITIDAEPEKEYQECLLKLHALQKALC